ncbi:RNA-binding protein 4.1-like isoform 1-T2 [Pholidichthys leucotaenia]
MVKIFIGNLSPSTTKDEVEALFTPYGTVTECAKYVNYAFVHLEDRKSATKAIRELHRHKLNGRLINVELSRGKNQGPVKLHVANVEKGFEKELRELFLEYGTVTECSIIKNFAFVHMPNHDEAMDALQGLDNTEFQGKRIHVQVSKSRPRGFEEEYDYPPPPDRGGYPPPPPPPHYLSPRPEPPFRGRMSAYPAPPPPPPPPPRRPAYPGYGERDSFGSMVDLYERYRARPPTTPSYDDRRPTATAPPPPSSSLIRDRLASSLDPYTRRPLPVSSAYSSRDRSPIRRALTAAPAGNGYAYERSRLSPSSRAPAYAAPRPRDSYVDRVPLPPPPAPRYAGY